MRGFVFAFLLLFGGLSTATKVISICNPDIGNYSLQSFTDQVEIHASSVVGSYQCKLRIRVPFGFVALVSSSSHYVRGYLKIYSPDQSLDWEIKDSHDLDHANRPLQFRSDSRDILFDYNNYGAHSRISNWAFTVTAVRKNAACSCGFSDLIVPGNSWSSPGLNLTSPAWPNYYPANCRCQWTVSPVDRRRTVVAQVISFRSRQGDSLTFLDGPDGSQLGTCSGGANDPSREKQVCFPGRIIGTFTPGAGLSVSFHSGGGHQEQGFLVRFITVDVGCGQNVINLEPQRYFILRSPAYPFRYTPNINCTWTVLGPIGTESILMMPNASSALYYRTSKLRIYDGSWNLVESTNSNIDVVRVKGRIMRIQFASGNYPSSFQSTFSLVLRADGEFKSSTTAPFWKTTTSAKLHKPTTETLSTKTTTKWSKFTTTKTKSTWKTTKTTTSQSPAQTSSATKTESTRKLHSPTARTTTSQSPSQKNPWLNVTATSVSRPSPSLGLIVGASVGGLVLLLLLLGGAFACGMIAERRRGVAARSQHPLSYDMAWRAPQKPSAPPKYPDADF